jgi:hypothetical protein
MGPIQGKNSETYQRKKPRHKVNIPKSEWKNKIKHRGEGKKKTNKTHQEGSSRRIVGTGHMI